MGSSKTAVEKTIKILASSHASEAVEALRTAMQSDHGEIRSAAFHATVTCRNQRGLAQMIREFDQLQPEQIKLLRENRQLLTSIIRASLLSESTDVQKNAVLAIEQLAPLEVLPQLLHCLEQGTPGYDGVLDWAVRFLTNALSREFNGNRPKKHSHEHLLAEIVLILQKAIANWRRHERDIFLSVFLKVYPRMTQCTGELADITSNPKHPVYPMFLKKILQGNDPEVLQFIVHSMGKPAPPSSVLVTVAQRTDILFLKVFLEAVSYASNTFQENLKRIHRFEWTRSVTDLLDKLDQGYHQFLVDLVRYSGLTDDEKLRIYETVVKFGNVYGRSAVVESLTDKRSHFADTLMLELADDEAPEVQSAALLQLRRRGIRSATTKLMQYIDSPHKNVKKTLHIELPEFRMKRFLEKYSQLTSEQRRTMLSIIRKIEPNMMEEILHELRINDFERQDRALELIAMSRNIVDVEDELTRFARNTLDRRLKIKTLKLLAAGSNIF